MRTSRSLCRVHLACLSESPSRGLLDRAASLFQGLLTPPGLRPKLVTKSRPCTTSKMTSQADPQALIEQLQLLNADPSAYFKNDAQKRDFQKSVRQAETAVEEPFETMQRLVYGVSDWCVALSQTVTADPHPAATPCYGTHWPRSRHLRSTCEESRWSTA
jgi:hypothetical protein